MLRAPIEKFSGNSCAKTNSPIKGLNGKYYFFPPTSGNTGLNERENVGVSLQLGGFGDKTESMEDDTSVCAEERYDHTFFHTMHLFHGS